MYGRWDGSDEATQHVVEDALQEITGQLGLESFLLVFQEQSELSPLRVGVLDGSTGDFAREYIGRRWFAIDPLLAKARQLIHPFWGWDAIAIESNGQAALRALATAEGFRTIAVIPALSPWHGVTGALYLGSSAAIDPPRNFSSRHAELRAMAIDLLGWAVRNTYRRELGADFELKTKEREALRCELLGYTCSDTAALMDLSPRALKYVFDCAKAKLHAPSRREAARRALMAGVLSLY